MTMRRAQTGADQAFSFGRSKARRMSSETPVVTFADVAGCDEAKADLEAGPVQVNALSLEDALSQLALLQAN